jgi:tetratricopeptide (TPR) repeat protein
VYKVVAGMRRGPGSTEQPDSGASAEGAPAAGTTDEGSVSQTGDSIGRALIGARPKDPPGLVIAQAVVAARLFESGGFGRFKRFDRLAAGGMGVIYTAYDPDLDRMVAIKAVHVPGRESSRALAEGRALARLSHDNIVRIHDVGFIDAEHLYFVMELVLGPTLRTWAKGRSRREIVRAYRQAGNALAAAHAKGLVHRDFKPDNAIMGENDRVRVIDFGLACEASDPDRPQTFQRAGAGTPRYMPPEQTVGGEITAAADQYAFCASLAEALGDGASASGGPVPRWLQAVIDRGRAPFPSDRFPSMSELLKALDRDPALARRKWTTIAVLAVGGVVTFVAGRSTLTDRAASCSGGDARIAGAWGGEERAGALARIASLNEYGRSVQSRLEAQLRDYEQRWVVGYRNACLAHSQGAQSDALLDRRMACLERGRAALTSVAEVVRTTDANGLPNLVLAARALPDPDACGDLDSLLTNVEPPATAIAPRVAEVRARLAAARIQLAAGRQRQARAVAEEATADARKLGYPPLLAEALLVAGHATMAMDDRFAAVAPLTEAYTLAFQAGDQSLAVEAWARRAWVQGTTRGGTESLAGLDVVEAAAAHRLVSDFARALLYNNVGVVELAMNRRDRAHDAFERASRAAGSVAGPGAAELLVIRGNLAATIDDPERRDAVLAQAVAEQVRALGNDHPETQIARWRRGAYAVRFTQAIDILAPTCPEMEVHNGPLAKRCWAEIAFIRAELGNYVEAEQAMRRAASIELKSELDVTEVVPYLHLWQGNATIASREFAAALRAIASPADQPWWDHLERAGLELGRARADRAAGRLFEARRSLDLSVRRLADIASRTSAPEIDRRLGRARAELAKVLAAQKAPRRAIASVAAPAVAWLRQAGGLRSEISELARLSAPAGHTD